MVVTASPVPAPISDVDQQELLRRRYGSGGRPSIPLIIVLTSSAALFVGWVLWAAVGQADQPVRWSTVGYSDLSDTSVTVSFDVFKPANAEVSCVVSALDVSNTEVGRATVPVTSDLSDVHVVYALLVTSRPTAAEVTACQLTP